MTKVSEKTYSLSVIIVAMNEADRIIPCLDSVAPIADEIIVFDSGSQDRTVEICRKYTDKVFVTPDWPGDGPQKQRALGKAVCQWVLCIDADEVLTPELREEIHAVLISWPVEKGFKLKWLPVIFGHKLYHGRSARAPLRLFQREGAGFSTAVIHGKLTLAPGRIGKLKGRLLHYTHRDFEHYLYKNRLYAWIGAKNRFEAGKTGFGLSGAAFRALLTFIVVYFLRLGFLDGRVGFLVAVMYSQSSFNKYAGLWTLRQESAMKQAAAMKKKAGDSGDR
ncbi:MAG: glycosyl transferase [Desulfobacterales bacterium CG23_combo_of_CG06-09_8_20_14_all_51_8]|nr:MAG: glycosyl transferase [Desulfobacterales bacterium CG23_combo_of_CG06-09_8_20_14_all_51_8]